MLKFLSAIIVGIAMGCSAYYFDVDIFSVGGLIIGLPWIFTLVLTVEQLD